MDSTGSHPPEGTILVVDDEATTRDVVSVLLRSHGYEVISARNGSEALEKVRQTRPDLILLDVVMPELDGLETCRRLKADEATRDVPVVFMTGLGETESKIQGFRVGAADYITKPIQTVELLARIGMHLRIEEQTRRLREQAGKLQRTHDRLNAEIAARGRRTRAVPARDALLENERRLRAVVEQAGDAFFLHDREGRILDANRRACDSLGYTRDELLSMAVSDIDTEAGKRVDLGRLWNDLAPGEFVNLEGRHRRADGTEFPVEVRLGMLDRGDGEEILALVRDITERKRSEARIDRLRRLEEELLGLGSIHEKAGKITDAVVDLLDADFARVWMIRPGDLCESGCLHADVESGPHVCRERDRCLHLIASSGRYTHLDGDVHRRVPFGCYKIGRVASAEEPGFLTNDVVNDPRVHDREWAKRLGLVSFAGRRLVSPDGPPVGVLAVFGKRAISPEEATLLETIAGVASNVIETSRTEERLQDKAQIIESAASVITTTDPGGIVTYVNPAFLRTWGFDDPAEVLGRPLWEFWLVRDRLDEILTALWDGGTWSDDVEARKKNGTVFRVRVSAAMMRDREGAPTGMMSTTVELP